VNLNKETAAGKYCYFHNPTKNDLSNSFTKTFDRLTPLFGLLTIKEAKLVKSKAF